MRLQRQVHVVRPDRGRCRAYAVTQVLSPASALPCRAHCIEVIGDALLAAADGVGYTQAAAACAAPRSTVQDWVRAARRSGPALIGNAARPLRSTGEPAEAWPTPSLPVSDLTAFVTALGAAAQALASKPSFIDGCRR